MKGQLASLLGQKKALKNKPPHLTLGRIKKTKEKRRRTMTCSWWQLSLQGVFVSSAHIPFRVDTTALLQGEDASTRAFGERSTPLVLGCSSQLDKRAGICNELPGPSVQRECCLGTQHFPRKHRQGLSLSFRHQLPKSPFLQWLILLLQLSLFEDLSLHDLAQVTLLLSCLARRRGWHHSNPNLSLKPWKQDHLAPGTQPEVPSTTAKYSNWNKLLSNKSIPWPQSLQIIPVGNFKVDWSSQQNL